MAMRPPMPALTLSRRAKIILLVVAALIVLLIVASSLVGVYINWLWFGSVGFRDVYQGIFFTRLVLFLVFGALTALILGGNIAIAYVLRPPFRPLSNEQQNLERYRVILEPRKKWILAGIMVLAGALAGLSEQGDWQTWMLWQYGSSFGIKDLEFHRDISFFAWDYPVYRILLGFGFISVFFAILLAVATHYLFGAIRIQTPGPKITLSARRHITILVFVFIALKALAYWLDRYGLVFSNRGKVTGASYADVNAALPAKTILFWIAIIIAALVLASMWLKSARLPVIGFVVLLVLSILIGGIYPAAVQQFTVKPNASTKEAPYISRNIEATRQAYGIVTGKDVQYKTYDVTNSPNTSALGKTNPTISDLRILDPNVLSPTFTQQQQIRNVYGFADKLDVDRYKIKEKTNDYIVGVRELDAASLSGNQTNWINEHTVYTHGYGFVAAAADKDVTNPDKSKYAEGDIPPSGIFDGVLKQPEVYYGELLPEYSIVGAHGAPQEYNGSDAAKVTYHGGGGVSLGNFFTRLALTVKYKQTNFLLNSAVSAPGAKIIFNRDPRDIVKKVAPFLTVDGDPYPIVDSQSGDIVWIVDGYTTMSRYPYSEQESLSDLTSDSLTKTDRTASQPNDTINYIRNSVKATVDAYTGKVTLYAWNQQSQRDPILSAWMRAFPGLVKPQSSMPQSIREHVRYPEDLFEVQRALLGTYHVDNPVTFYNVGDKWTVPTDPANPSANQPPYYQLASPPTGGTTPEFQLTSPMIVNNRQNLAAYISVNSDYGPHYGQLTVLKVPTKTVINGPEQVSNILNTNPVITKDLSLFNAPGGGSQVIHGNLLTLPIGNSFLYVEPLYVQGSSGNAAFPTLQRVLVVYGDKTGYEATLPAALENLNQSSVGAGLPGVGGATTGPPPDQSSTPTTPTPTKTPTTKPTKPSVQALLTQLQSAFQDLDNAYKSGDPVAVGQAQKEIKKLTDEYLKDYGTPPAPSGAGQQRAPSK